MTCAEILSRVDHTALAPGLVWDDITRLCDEAAEAGACAVCIPPYFVHRAAEYARVPVCTVIGFPLGNTMSIIKLAEAQEALSAGARELDMVLNIGMIRARDERALLYEIASVKGACGKRLLKVILECCLLSDEEKAFACRIAAQAGADFVKTSTGFSTGGATVHDVKLLRGCCPPQMQVKAAGGITTFEQAQALLGAGADRLGSSRLVRDWLRGRA